MKFDPRTLGFRRLQTRASSRQCLFILVNCSVGRVDDSSSPSPENERAASNEDSELELDVPPELVRV